MPYFEVEPDVRLHYEDRGSGRAIVFVHGWGGAGDVWDYQVLDLADRFRCVTVDLRGHGDSDKPWGTYDYDLFCRDLQAVMTGLGLEDVTVVGWSMGGHIGLKYVTTVGAPVSRLVITGSGPRFWQAEDARYGTPADQVQGLVDAIKLARAETIAALYDNNFHRTDLQATRDWFIQTGWKVPAFVGVSSFEAIVAEDLRAALPSIDIPVAVFSGRHDQIWAPEWSEVAAKSIRGAELRYFENSGHVAFIEDRAEWNEELEKFIESH